MILQCKNINSDTQKHEEKHEEIHQEPIELKEEKTIPPVEQTKEKRTN